jgi:NAD+ synthetase
MQVALAQINPTVGDLVGNAGKHRAFVRDAVDRGATLVVFPELSLIGYPPKDLLLKSDFIERQRALLHELAAEVPGGVFVLVGYAEVNTSPIGRPLHNSMALLSGGGVVDEHHKTLLPTYDVFDESRYFEPGPRTKSNNIVRIGEREVGVSICEDLWNDERLIGRRLYHENPIRDLHQHGADLLVNASASPFVIGKHAFRLELFAGQVRDVGVPLVYVNQVGGNDELVFDGRSVVMDAAGEVVAQAKGFEEDLLIVNVEAGGGRVEPMSGDMEALRRALVLGLRDYVTKCGFGKVVIGLSGGIDSALTAALAVEAFGAEKVHGVALPSRYSSDGSVTDAQALADNLKITMDVVPIEPMHAAYTKALAPTLDVQGLTDENLQARIRGATLMAYSNSSGALLLTTGNKSELAVGYCTLYGDMCGGLAVISDVPKTDVYALSRHLNEVAGRELIPESTITKPPSAELRPDQKDTDSLPDYDTLDAILERYVEQEMSVGAIVADGFDAADVKRVIGLVDRNEYKRRQAAPGLKVTSRAFGFGRRMPIAQRHAHHWPGDGEPAPNP